MTLKVGDKAKSCFDGEVVTVTEIGNRTYGPNYCQARFDDGSYGIWRLRELEKIEDPAPKFKVGDRALSGKSTGVTVTDPAYRSGSAIYVKAKFDHPKWGYGLWKESELTKIESGVPFFLRNGDFVVNRKTGRKGEVIRGMVYDVNDTFRPTCKGVPAAAIEEYEDHYPGTYDLIKKDAPW